MALCPDDLDKLIEALSQAGLKVAGGWEPRDWNTRLRASQKVTKMSLLWHCRV